MANKTWKEKMEGAHPAKVEVLDRAGLGLPAGARLYIATPKIVRDYVRRIPKGKTRSVRELRDSLARKNGADATCPLTTGIFLRIVAEAALDEHRAGKPVEKVSPFWRVIKPASPLAKKLSCGPAFIVKMRRLEASLPPKGR